MSETAPVWKQVRSATLLGFLAAVVGLPLVVFMAGLIGGPDADRNVFVIMWIAWCGAIPVGALVVLVLERWRGSPLIFGPRIAAFLAVLWVTAFPLLCVIGFAGEHAGWLPTIDCSNRDCDSGGA